MGQRKKRFRVKVQHPFKHYYQGLSFLLVSGQQRKKEEPEVQDRAVEGLIDLHGLSVRTAREVSWLRILDIRDKGLDQFKIVYGNGSGKLEKLVRDELAFWCLRALGPFRVKISKIGHQAALLAEIGERMSPKEWAEIAKREKAYALSNQWYRAWLNRPPPTYRYKP